mmetsp:Transcript_1861/g.4635  ORF Transcript_1861/g.4635 Transcript_1861/m.4635 type:complete len:248 (-) Transcript_1861:799-1542(-)
MSSLSPNTSLAIPASANTNMSARSRASAEISSPRVRRECKSTRKTVVSFASCKRAQRVCTRNPVGRHSESIPTAFPFRNSVAIASIVSRESTEMMLEAGRSNVRYGTCTCALPLSLCLGGGLKGGSASRKSSARHQPSTSSSGIGGERRRTSSKVSIAGLPSGCTEGGLPPVRSSGMPKPAIRSRTRLTKLTVAPSDSGQGSVNATDIALWPVCASIASAPSRKTAWTRSEKPLLTSQITRLTSRCE